jgi:hypothetical protein
MVIVTIGKAGLVFISPSLNGGGWFVNGDLLNRFRGNENE